MGILAKRFPEFDVILQIFRGEITRDVWMDYYAGFSARAADRFITYVDPGADLSSLDLASAPELKRIVAVKLREVYGDRPVVSILVPGSKAQAPYVKFWRGFEKVGGKHPARSVLASDLREACALLRLPERAWKMLNAAVEDQAIEPQAPPPVHAVRDPGLPPSPGGG